MSVLKGVLKEEYERLNQLIKKYKEEIKNYPKGSISYKNIKGHSYAYLGYREKGKLCFKYFGKKSKEIKKVSQRIKSRKKYESLLKQALLNLKELKKAIGKTK